MDNNGTEDDDENTFKILIASDCHLGCHEKDAVRCNDSLVTFEEILQIATSKDVDFILLGGDLYHENKPPRWIQHKCVELIRKYCMGSKPVQFEIVSNQQENFKHEKYQLVNFQDPNLNISYPLFSIHGNHDDPIGKLQLGALDMLSVSGLVNQFGKCLNLEKIEIAPILLQKGNTKLALYGLGAIREERIHRLFTQEKVKMFRPKEDMDNWFNLFVLHQNRVRHGPTSFIPEHFLPDFLDLVIWGHEHECRLAPEKATGDKDFFVSQPGSSVATSLCAGEAVLKNVGILQIKDDKFKMTSVPLKTVRQFYFEDVVPPANILDNVERFEEYCHEIVEQFLNRAAAEHTGHANQPDQPLIRLRVEYTDTAQTFIVQRFGKRYKDRVANPEDIILFCRKRHAQNKTELLLDREALNNVTNAVHFDAFDMVREYFENAGPDGQMVILSEKGLSAACREFVEKDNTSAIEGIVQHQLDVTLKKLQECSAMDEENLSKELDRIRDERNEQAESEEKSIRSVLNACRSTRSAHNEGDDFSDEDMDDSFSATPSRGRGRGRGSRARGRGRTSRGASTSRKTKQNVPSPEASPPPPSKAPSKAPSRAPARRTTTSRAAKKQSVIYDDDDVVEIPESDDD